MATIIINPDNSDIKSAEAGMPNDIAYHFYEIGENSNNKYLGNVLLDNKTFLPIDIALDLWEEIE